MSNDTLNTSTKTRTRKSTSACPKCAGEDSITETDNESDSDDNDDTTSAIVREIERRINDLPDHHRLESNVTDVSDHDVWDATIDIERFGRADLKDLHDIVSDWEVQSVSHIPNDATVQLGVKIDTEPPVGGYPDE